MGHNDKLRELFINYGSYHHNIVNKVCHLICVPTILIATFQLIRHATLNFLNINPLTFPVLGLIVGSLYYISINIPIGIIASIIFPLLWQLQMNLTSNMDKSDHFKLILSVYCVCWIFQFITHGFFQKRKPALLDDLFQTIKAPLFVLTEFLFIFGWKKEIRQLWEKEIVEVIKKLQNSGKAK